ncbi:MAG: CAP domain-containing protein [Planctomycetaceae bacterium]|jgi:uncharacterized protein YkwD|nr:CAP domain-containing protein [Planctomycetaceae bacterium]
MKNILLLFLFFAFAPVVIADECQKCFESINNYRTQSQCPKLIWSDEIAADCQQWADKLQSIGAIRYRGRLFRKGGGIHGYSGENCACGNESGYETFRQWLTSEAGHREFMERQDTMVGAVAKSGLYWVFRAEKSIETYKSKTKKQ